MKYITSRTNPLVKEVTALHSRKGRTEQQRYIAEGLRTCQTLSTTHALVNCYITDAISIDDIPFIAPEKIIEVTDDVMKKLSTAKTPSGILCVFEIPTQKQLTSLSSSVILYEIADPGNMGTLIRTAAALGLEQIILVGGVDVWNAKVVHASAGTLGNVQIMHADWHTIQAYKKDYNLCALVVKDGISPNEINFENTVFVIGSEAHGLSDDVISSCDSQCTLPMPGGTESLNAAVAGSVALYCAYVGK